MGSSLYLILAVIDLFSFAPKARTNDTNDTGAVGEAAGSQSNRALTIAPNYAKAI